MGLLKDAGEMNIDVNDDTPPGDEGGQQQRQEPERILVPPEMPKDREPSGEPIPLATPHQERMSRAREARKREAEDAAKEVARQVEERLQRAREEDNRRWEQRLYEMQQRQQQAAPVQQSQAPQGPDPEELLRQAKKALDGRDFEEYERLKEQAADIKYERRLKAEIAKLQPQQQQPQQPTWLVGMYGRYPRVSSDRRGEPLLDAKLRELNTLTGKVGPELFEEAFKQVDRMLGGEQAVQEAGRAQFDRSSAAVLSGVPTTRPASTAPTGAKVAGVRLSDYERGVAKKCKIPEDEYARHLAITHPERVEK